MINLSCKWQKTNTNEQKQKEGGGLLIDKTGKAGVGSWPWLGRVPGVQIVFSEFSVFLPAVSLWVALLSSSNIGGRGRGRDTDSSCLFF